MKPTMVIVGRPNVGKSTLFNRLTRRRDAIVADTPGLTRDRHYGQGRVGGKPYIVVDTGGLEPAPTGILRAMAEQTLQAVAEADAVIFMVDGRQGLTAQDRAIAEQLRAGGKRIWLVVNKTEGMERAIAAVEFHELGLGDPLAISAAHGEGVSDLAELILAGFPEAESGGEDQERYPRIAIVGRPNVGKSTLVNRLLGEDRLVVFDEPGTTRDAIEVEFERGGRHYILVDTAGLRRRGRVTEPAEKFSVIKTLHAIERANVVILVLDASERITDQDAHIAGYVVEAGRALVVAVNKWDGLDELQRSTAKQTLARNLNFIEFAPVHFISALNGSGIRPLFDAVEAAYQAANARLSTPKLTRALMAAVTRQEPPRAGTARPKLRYAHQGGVNPPRIVIHGSGLDRISAGYRRYLERFFRDTFKLKGTCLRVEFRRGRNPYDRKRAGR